MTEVRVCNVEARVISMTEVRISMPIARCDNAHSEHRYAFLVRALGSDKPSKKGHCNL